MIDKSYSIEVLCNHRCRLGEGPVWDARNDCICWVDILKGEIHEYYEEEKRHRILPVHEMIGAVALMTDGNFLAALKTGIAKVNRDTGEVSQLVNPEDHLPGNRFNDGKCDPEGRFWIGSMALEETKGAGSLYMVDKDLSVHKMIEGVTISNGLAWSPDHHTFYYIDTPTFEVAAYDYDPATGNIFNRRVAIKIPQLDGSPDGMTIDSEGCLWIAHWDGWQVTRWNPVNGEKLDAISLPVAKVTSCAFGGPGLKDLYVTTASEGLTEKEKGEQPLAGAVFRIRKK